MRKSSLVGGLAAAVASMFLVLPPPGVSAQAPGGGGGGGGGGTGEVYSDLFIALRDLDGVPILSKTFWEGVPGDAVPVTCIQPISYDLTLGTTQMTNPADGRTVSLIPLVGRGLDGGPPVAGRHGLRSAAGLHRRGGRSRAAQPRAHVRRGALEEARRRRCAARGRRERSRSTVLDGSPRTARRSTRRPIRPPSTLRSKGDTPAPPPPADGRPVAGEPGGLMDTGTIPILGRRGATDALVSGGRPGVDSAQEIRVTDSTTGCWPLPPSAPQRASRFRSRSTRSSTTTAPPRKVTSPTGATSPRSLSRTRTRPSHRKR